ncbi:hypothetical protein F6R98_02940 [Candidatus Methylospira mobilis]|uniref:Type I restriction modification DNA specificity domain-containing protein n=1 Tax=Candidatus Methylospira mobilis TaxID=1808979 RepID=A0A5Q0BF08_9GAMM|nr:restriction endonuclease subunit S [Candidatus Methylospira mobilis]QFY41712.1 hypothetical protein F6R98_02940 [Candidatus Methylospira mobilis]
MNAELLLQHFDRISEVPDAIPRLRRFIFDLAVRGKLVEQDPHDEPAAELLKRIQAEKVRLVREGTLRRQKQLRTVDKDEVPNISPVNWKWERLGALSTLITKGSTPTSYGHSFTETGVNFIKVEAIKKGRLFPANVTSYISEATHNFLARSRLDDGDILFSIAGSIGTCAVVTKEILPANTNQALAIIRGTKLIYIPSFLLICIQSSVAQDVLDKSRGGAMNNVSLEDIQNFVVPLPPLAEQHRIVAKVDELMTLCVQLEAAKNKRETRRDRLVKASLQRICVSEPEEAREAARFHLDNLPRLSTRPEHIKQLRQTILNLAVRGRLVPQDPNDEPAATLPKRSGAIPTNNIAPFQIPDSWQWTTVEQTGENRLGKMLDKAKNKGSPRRYLRNINVRWFDFNLSDLYEMPFEDEELDQFALRHGDVLICEGGEPGRAAVWDERESSIYFQKAIHRVRFSGNVNPEFFVNVLRESSDCGRLSSYFTGVGIKHFTGKGLASFVFPLPPITEQQRIVAKIDELMTLCDQLDTQLTTTETDSRRLLAAALHAALSPTMRLAA